MKSNHTAPTQAEAPVKELKTISKYEPELRSLITRLNAMGWPVVCVDNGEEAFNTSDADKICEEALAVSDCAHLFFYHPAGKLRKGIKEKTLWLLLVYGNDPGELVSDYACPDIVSKELEAFFTQFSEAWENAVPMLKTTPTPQPAEAKHTAGLWEFRGEHITDSQGRVISARSDTGYAELIKDAPQTKIERDALLAALENVVTGVNDIDSMKGRCEGFLADFSAFNSIVNSAREAIQLAKGSR